MDKKIAVFYGNEFSIGDKLIIELAALRADEVHVIAFDDINVNELPNKVKVHKIEFPASIEVEDVCDKVTIALAIANNIDRVDEFWYYDDGMCYFDGVFRGLVRPMFEYVPHEIIEIMYGKMFGAKNKHRVEFVKEDWRWT